MTINEESKNFDEELAELYPRLQQSARGLVGNREDAEDLCNETCAKAIKGKSTFEGRSSLWTWLYRILLNHRSTRFDPSSPTKINTVSIENELSDEDALSPDAIVENEEAIAALHDALQKLPPTQRQFLMEFKLNQTKQSKIASDFGCSEAYVSATCKRAIRRLRDLLSKEPKEDRE